MSQSLDAVLRGSLEPSQSAAQDPVRAAVDTGSLPAVSDAAPMRAKLTQAAEKFEGFFINQILQQMRKSMRDIDPDEKANAKHGEDDMVDMSDTMLAESLAQRHAFGVADALLKQLVPSRSSPGAPGTSPAVPATDAAAHPVSLSQTRSRSP